MIYRLKYTLLLLIIIAVQCKNPNAVNKEQNRVHAFRLKPGQDLKKEIDSFVKQENILAGWINTCVGSLTHTNIRFANQPSGSVSEGHFEIVSLTGTVSVNGSHLHISVSDSTGKTFGGHLLENNLVYTTAEIIIGESTHHVFTREKDGTTPWEELQVRKITD